MGPGNVKIADCKCDAGCATCGYGMPIEPFMGASGSNDCITCADDSSSAAAGCGAAGAVEAAKDVVPRARARHTAEPRMMRVMVARTPANGN